MIRSKPRYHPAPEEYTRVRVQMKRDDGLADPTKTSRCDDETAETKRATKSAIQRRSSIAESRPPTTEANPCKKWSAGLWVSTANATATQRGRELATVMTRGDVSNCSQMRAKHVPNKPLCCSQVGRRTTASNHEQRGSVTGQTTPHPTWLLSLMRRQTYTTMSLSVC